MVKPRKEIEKLNEYNPPAEGRKNYLRLDLQENTIGPSMVVLNAIRKVRPADISVYPEYGQINDIVAKYFGVRPDEIILTNGSNEAIKLIAEAFVERGNEIIIPSPTFPIYEQFARAAGGKIKAIAYDGSFLFPLKVVLKAINSKTKVIFLCNPNNPLGSVIRKNEITRILQKAKNAIVVVDEAYFEFYGKTAIPLIKKYGNLVVTRTFSKAFGLAGLRVGVAITNSKIIKMLRKVNQPFSLNSLACIALQAAIKDKKYAKNYAKEIIRSRKLLYKELKKLGLKFWESYGNFLVVYFGGQREYIYEKLKEKGILIRKKDNSNLLKDCLRIGIGTLPQTKKFLRTFRAILRGNNSS